MNKMSKKVYFLKRIGDSLSLHTKILLYKSIIALHLKFCSTVLLNIDQGQMQQFQKIQNRTMRVILKCNKYTPIIMVLDVLKFMNVKQQYTKQ